MSSQNLTLYAFETPQGLFNTSPYCVKADILLRMADMPFSLQIPENHKIFPKGKLPVLKDGDLIIEDSEFIRLHLAEQYGKTLDGSLSEQEKTVGHALIRMLDERTMLGLLQGRWIDDEGWKVLEELFFGELPKDERTAVGTMLREQVSGGVMATGFGKHSRDEQQKLLAADMQALASILADKPWFFSNEPTYIDAAIFGMLVNFYAAPIPTRMAGLVGTHSNLVAYVQRGLALWYPQSLEMVAAE